MTNPKGLADLRECPFCGGDAMYLPSTYHCQIECFKCGIRTREYKKQHEAISAWNRRTEKEVKE